VSVVCPFLLIFDRDFSVALNGLAGVTCEYETFPLSMTIHRAYYDLMDQTI
jgi:hypothetical protein